MDTFNPVSFAQTFAEIKKRREKQMREQTEKQKPEPEFKSQVVSQEEAKADAQRAKKKSQLSMYRDLLEDPETTPADLKLYKSQIKKLEKELGITGTPTTTTTVIKPNKAENYTPENTQSEDPRSTSYKGKKPGIISDGVTAEAPIEHEVSNPLANTVNRDLYTAIDAKAPPVKNEALSTANAYRLAKKEKLQKLRDHIAQSRIDGVLSRKASKSRIKNARKIGADDFAFGNEHAGLTDIDTRLSSLLHRSRISDTVKDDSGAIRRLDKDDISNYGLKPNLAANNQGEFDEDEVDAYKADANEFGLRPVKKYTKKDKSTNNNITYYYYADEDKNTATTEEQDPDKKRDYERYKEGKTAKVVTAGMAYNPEVAEAINNHALGKVLEHLTDTGVDLDSIDELNKYLPKGFLDKIKNYKASPLDKDIDDFVEDIVVNGNKDSKQRDMFFQAYTGALDSLTNKLDLALRSVERNQAAEDWRNANNTWKVLDKEDWSNTLRAARDKAGKQAKTVKAVDAHPGGYTNLITYSGNAMLGKPTTYNSKEFGGKFPEFDGVPVMVYYPAIKNQYNTEFKKKDFSDEEKRSREEKIIRGEDPGTDLIEKYSSAADKAIDSYVALSDADPLLVMPIGNDENYIAKNEDDAISKATNWLETKMGRIEPHYTTRFNKYKNAIDANNADVILKQFPGPGGFDAWYRKTAGTGKDITDALYDLKANKTMDARLKQLKKWGLDVNSDDWSIHPDSMFEQGGPFEGKGLAALNSETRQNALANWLQQLPTNSDLYTAVGNQLKSVEDKIKKVEGNSALTFEEKNRLLSNLNDARNKIMQAYRGALDSDDKTTYEDDNPYTKARQSPSLSYGRGLVDFGSEHGKAATIAAEFNQLADYTNGLTRDQINKEADAMNSLNNKEVADLRDRSRQPSVKKTVVKPLKKLTAKEVLEQEKQGEKAKNEERASDTVGAIVKKKDVKRDINKVVNSLTSEQQETLAAMSPEELQRLIAIVKQGQAPSE